jgi:hypothetical protein
MALTTEQKDRLAAFAERSSVHCAEINAKKEEIRQEAQTCQNCGTEGRIYEATGYGKDLNWCKWKGKERDGYLPEVTNLSGGDELTIAVCLECGQVQGEWPVEDPCIENEDEYDD